MKYYTKAMNMNSIIEENTIILNIRRYIFLGNVKKVFSILQTL
jgi:hypothetical protein